MASASRRRKLDTGKLVMVPASMLMLTVDIRSEAATAVAASASAVGVLRALSAALICAFYALIVWSYLRRGPAVTTSPSITASAVAVIAMLTPFVFPLLRGAQPGPGRQLASDLLIVAGTTWSVWSLRYLGRNLSVIAQARGVADRGPYRIVRHPLYTGEIVSAFGLALAEGTALAFALWVTLILMQSYRAFREEQVLVRALPGYREYRARTAALVPGLF